MKRSVTWLVLSLSTAWSLTAQSAPLVHYKFENNLSDSSPNVNHAFSWTGVSYAAGVDGQALSVTSSEFAQSLMKAGVSGNAARTLSLWINADSVQTNAPVSYGNRAAAGNLFEVLVGSGGYNLIGHFWGGGDDTIGYADGSYTPGTWTHVALVWDGVNTASLYQGGALLGSKNLLTDGGTVSQLTTADFPIFLGGNLYAGEFATGYSGMIDDVQLYDFAATGVEIAALFSNPGSEISPQPAHAGDFDNDGDVDGADFVAWQTNFPTASGAAASQGDADADGDVDGADFVVWQTNFPFTPGPGVSSVPEPASVMLVLLGGITVLARRRFWDSV